MQAQGYGYFTDLQDLEAAIAKRKSNNQDPRGHAIVFDGGNCRIERTTDGAQLVGKPKRTVTVYVGQDGNYDFIHEQRS